MATEKQKLAIKKVMENNGNVSKSMREVGYSENYSKNPQSLTRSKGWEELVEKYLPDKDLVKVHKEGLNAGKKVFKNNNATGEIDEVDFEPDFAVRHKYLDTAYKIKGKMVEKHDLNVEVSGVDITIRK